MYFQRRGQAYSFIYYDRSLKKNVRLKTSETPAIQDDAAAEAFCHKWQEKTDGVKLRIERRIAWQNQFHEFAKLLELYLRIRKEEAPNSWQSDDIYLKYYVFPFFLEKKSLNHLALWADYFEEFRDSLLTTHSIHKLGKNALAYATKNNVIKALNTFMQVMHRRRLVLTVEKCRYFEKSKLNRRNEESVIPEEVQKMIYHSLNEICHESAVFFWLSLKTGMRFSETLGLSLSDIFTSALENEALATALKPYPFSLFGYISLDSQLRQEALPKVVRKPLKGKKLINAENARIIPIFDKTAFNLLAELWNQARERFRKAELGTNPRNILLFRSLNKNIYSSRLRESQKRLNRIQHFIPHDTRHTYSTWLAGITGGNFNLCRMILGHSDLQTTLRYIHINAQIEKNMRSLDQMNSQMELVV